MSKVSAWSPAKCEAPAWRSHSTPWRTRNYAREPARALARRGSYPWVLPSVLRSWARLPASSRSFLEPCAHIHQSAIMRNRNVVAGSREVWYDPVCAASPRLADATRVTPEEVNIEMKDTNRQHA